MGKNTLAREGTNRSVRGGRTRGNASSGRGPSTSKSVSAARGSPMHTLTTGGGSDEVVVRGGPVNRGKGKDLLLHTKDDNIEKNAPKKGEKKVYKVRLTNAVVKKLIAAKSKGIHMKIGTSDKMEIHTSEGEKIQLDLFSPKKVEMIFIRKDDIVEPVGKVIGYDSTTTKSHAAVKRDRVVKKIRESYENETKGKRSVKFIESDKLPSEQEVKTKSKRQKTTIVPSTKVSSQLSNATRGGKSLRGKTRGGRTRTAEVADVEEVAESETMANFVRGGNIRGKVIGSGKSSRGRAKTNISDVPKVNAPAVQSVISTRGKRGRPPAMANTSSSKKGKSKANGQALSEWKPGQTITILSEFKSARKICEELEKDIQEVIEGLVAYEESYNNYANSLKNVTKGPTHDLLRDIEKHFGEGSQANKLMQKYVQLEKDIKTVHDELWRAANEGPVYED